MESLDSYPSPHVAADLVPLTVADGALWVLLATGPDGRGLALPGRFLRPKRRVLNGVAEVLQEKAGLDIDPHQATWLGLFDDPRRDPRGWTISAAFVLGLPWEAAGRSRLQAVPVVGDGVQRDLLYDHGEILSAALDAVREEYEQFPDPRGFLSGPFTLGQLREVHEAVLGEPLLRDTFRRRMEPMLRPLEGEVALTAGVGRPAQVYVVEQRERWENPRVRLPRAR